MPVISRQQAEIFALNAGFTGQRNDIIVAIAQAESGLNTTARNSVGNSAGVDRGILQINSYYHAEVSDAQADDPAEAFRQGFRISTGGTNFTPWSTYTNGAYRRFLTGKWPGPTGPGTPGTGVDAARKALLPSGHLISVWGDPRSGGRIHQGEDLQSSMGAPILAPETCKVTNNYVDPTGGNALYLESQVSDRHWYLCHFDRPSTIPIGSIVQGGQQIATVGMSGDAAGTVPHLHYQVGPKGRWADPRIVLAAWSPSQTVPTNPGGPTGPGSLATLVQRICPGGQVLREYSLSHDGIDIGGVRESAPLFLPEGGVIVDEFYDKTNGKNKYGLSWGYALEFQGDSGTYYTFKFLQRNNYLTVGKSYPAGAQFGTIKNDDKETGARRVSFHLTVSRSGFAPNMAQDPASVIAQAGAGGFTTSVGLFSGPFSLGAIIHNTIAHTPGFAGIALAVDEALQFPGLILYEPLVNSLYMPDFSNIFRSIFVTATGNFIPFVCRAILIMLGVLLIGGLLYTLIKPQVSDALGVIGALA